MLCLTTLGNYLNVVASGLKKSKISQTTQWPWCPDEKQNSHSVPAVQTSAKNHDFPSMSHCYWNHFNKRLAEVGQCLETPENVRNWKAFRGLQALESRCHSTFQLQSISIGCLEAPGWVGGIWEPSSESGNDYKAAREDTAASGPSQCSSHPSLCKWASGDSWRWTEVTKLGGHSHAPAALWWEWTWLFQPRCVRLVSRKHSPTTWLQSSRIISHQTLVS